MTNNLPFSKSDRLIYSCLLITYSLFILLLLLWQAFLLANFLWAIKVNWINFLYLESEYGALYWVPPLVLLVVAILLGGSFLLNYKYDVIPIRPGYRYSYKKNSVAFVKQIQIDRRFRGLSYICLLIVLILKTTQKTGLFVKPPFYLAEGIVWIFVISFFTLGILYNIVSLRLFKIEKQNQIS
jgi:hypothetical protein